MSISLDFITGVMLGIEFFDKDEMFETGGGMILDLFIVRILVEKTL